VTNRIENGPIRVIFAFRVRSADSDVVIDESGHAGSVDHRAVRRNTYELDEVPNRLASGLAAEHPTGSGRKIPAERLVRGRSLQSVSLLTRHKQIDRKLLR